MIRRSNRALIGAVAITLSGAAIARMPADTPAASAFAAVRAEAPARLAHLPLRVTGRVRRITSGRDFDYARQWPGTYFDTAFRGRPPLIRIGTGAAIYRVTLDDARSMALVRPEPGFYRLTGVRPGTHRLRVQIVSESQAEATRFGGFYAQAGTVGTRIAAERRQIEFIGDSHTVGYGNTAPGTTCTQDEVWATTDTSQGLAGQLARRYAAGYQVNAISGRGVVRNYDGGAGATLPVAYRSALLAGAPQPVERSWRPQVIVVALGTNDFSTPLRVGEKWPDRAALHADYERTYLSFLRQLRAVHPQALMIVWATDLAQGEIAREAERVVAQARAAGDRRITFVPVRGLTFTACHGHPSVADDRRIADAVGRVVDARPNTWRTR